MQTHRDEYGFVWIRHYKRKKPEDRVADVYNIAMEEPYLFETFTYMRERESRLKKFRGRSPQKRHRRILVDWICTSGEESEFPKGCCYFTNTDIKLTPGKKSSKFTHFTLNNQKFNFHQISMC